MDRVTRCVTGWAVVWERTGEVLQAVVAAAAPAAPDDSAACAPDHTRVSYPGTPAVAPGKNQTYSVEADNAEVRHDLGRRSRRVSRSIAALHRAVTLIVPAWNRRQLHKRAYPRYTCHVRDFVGPCS